LISTVITIKAHNKASEKHLLSRTFVLVWDSILSRQINTVKFHIFTAIPYVYLCLLPTIYQKSKIWLSLFEGAGARASHPAIIGMPETENITAPGLPWECKDMLSTTDRNCPHSFLKSWNP
jgi:hypothetical protein